MGQTVLSLDAPRFAVTDAGIMDHGVKAAELVDLFGNAARPRNGGEIADHDVCGFGERVAGIVCPGPVAAVKNDLVALFDEQLGGHQA
jgi:hypothetical protein